MNRFQLVCILASMEPSQASEVAAQEENAAERATLLLEASALRTAMRLVSNASVDGRLAKLEEAKEKN